MGADDYLADELVSIITPVYNCENYIAQAIESVLAQTYQHWEMILVDDCSSDGSAAIIASYQKTDNRIKYKRLDRNSGAAAARNVGLEESRIRGAQYVALLDADDYWKPEMLEKMIRRAEDTSADIVYCSYEIVDEQGVKLCNDFIVPEETDYRKSLVRSVITCSTVLMTGQQAQKSRFPIDTYHEDIALWFRVLKDGAKVRGVLDVLASYRQRRDSKTANKAKSAYIRWGIYREHLKMPLLESVFVMIQYAYYGFIKYKRI